MTREDNDSEERLERVEAAVEQQRERVDDQQGTIDRDPAVTIARRPPTPAGGSDDVEWTHD